MKKNIFHLLFLFLLMSVSAFSAKQKDPTDLINLFNKLQKIPGAKIVDVDYTGSFSKQVSSFEWLRAKGHGLTHGKRIAIGHYDAASVMNIHHIFERYSKQQHVILEHQDAATTFQDKIFFGYRYKNDSLYFLYAMADSELCIPRQWPTLNHYVGPLQNEEKSLWTKFDKKTRYALGLARLWSGIKQNFVFMDRVKLNWDSVYAATLPMIEQAQSDGEAVQILQKMAAMVHDGHTFVWGNDDNYTAPFTFKCFDGKVYVDNIWSSNIKAQGLRRGMELLSINNESVKAYAEKNIIPYLSSSTPQWTDHLLYYNSNLTSLPEGTITKYSFSKGLVINYKSGEPLLDLQQDKPTYEWKVLKGHIGYLHISTFNNSQMQALFSDLYPQILKTKSLIIDIRDNEGGNSGNGDFILSHFFNDSIKTDSWRTRQYNAAFTSWGIPQEMYSNSSENMSPINGVEHYLNPIVLLVDNGTFSAAEDFTSVFKGMKRGVIVGVPTGGSTGNGVRMELIPNVCFTNICSKWDICSDGTEFVGIGLKPDIPITETYQSYFVQNEDLAMKAALEYLSCKH